jgi:hypothetical protein
MILYVTLGFIFLAIVLYVVYRLAAMSGGQVVNQAAPPAPKYDWQSVLGRTFERGAGRAIDEYFDDDDKRTDTQNVFQTSYDGSKASLGGDLSLTLDKFGPAS